ncbi:MAG: DNA-binding GntR family transcriptional regulator [Hyphomicrobiaceae bacterium]|jgi:DNA-binding GntR family transcriptional regulator
MPTDRPDIFEELQAQILEGALQPGDRLKEAELAARYGISRTPVREALRRLETRGLLMHAPHKGMVVAELEASATAELYVMREILDGAAAALAAQHATEPEIAAMQRQITRDRQILDEPEQLAATNRSFHLSIYRAAHNRFLMKSSDALAESLALLGPTTLSVGDRGPASIDEHEVIVAAIRERDGPKASTAARLHIRNAFEARLLQLDARTIDQTKV